MILSVLKTLLKDDIDIMRLINLFTVETKLVPDAGTETEIHPAIFESFVTDISGGTTAIPGNSEGESHLISDIQLSKLTYGRYGKVSHSGDISQTPPPRAA